MATPGPGSGQAPASGSGRRPLAAVRDKENVSQIPQPSVKKRKTGDSTAPSDTSTALFKFRSSVGNQQGSGSDVPRRGSNAQTPRSSEGALSTSSDAASMPFDGKAGSELQPGHEQDPDPFWRYVDGGLELLRETMPKNLTETRKLEKQKDYIQKLKICIRAGEVSYKLLKDQLKAEREELADTRLRTEDLENQCAAISKAAKEKDIRLAEVQAMLSQLKEELRRELSDKELALKDLQAKQQLLQQDVERLVHERNVMELERESLRDKLEAEGKRAAEYWECFKKADDDKKNLQEKADEHPLLNERLKVKEGELAVKQEELASKQAELCSLKTELHNKIQEIETMKIELQEVPVLREKLQSKDEKIASLLNGEARLLQERDFERERAAALLAEKDRTLAEKDQLITEKDRAIVEKDRELLRVLAEKDKEIYRVQAKMEREKEDKDRERAEKAELALLLEQTRRQLAEAPAALKAESMATLSQDVEDLLGSKELAIAKLEQEKRTLHLELKAAQKQIAKFIEEAKVKSQETHVLECKVHALMEEQKRLHNEIVELKGNVRVFCRVRPLLEGELDQSNAGSTLTFPNPDEGKEIVLSEDLGKTHTFCFDKTFRPDASQFHIFAEVSQLVRSSLDGYKVCVFTYGQTGSGKTYTMLGGQSEEDRGMIPRALDQIFRSRDERAAMGCKFHIRASVLEIYNENIQDLLVDIPGAYLPVPGGPSARKEWKSNPPASTSSAGTSAASTSDSAVLSGMVVDEDVGTIPPSADIVSLSPTVDGSSPDTTLAHPKLPLTKAGLKSQAPSNTAPPRSTPAHPKKTHAGGSSAQGARSVNSKSGIAGASEPSLKGKEKVREKYQIHFDRAGNMWVSDLLEVDLEQAGDAKAILAQAMKKRVTAKTDMNAQSSRSHLVFIVNIHGEVPDPKTKKVQIIDGQLSLIDLAGTERLKDSNAEGTAKKETQNINRSLHLLNRVFNNLRTKEKHIPFRDSKLTTLLQNSLGGASGKSLMVLNISPDVSSIGESLRSLRFGDHVQQTDIGTAQRTAYTA